MTSHFKCEEKTDWNNYNIVRNEIQNTENCLLSNSSDNPTEHTNPKVKN